MANLAAKYRPASLSDVVEQSTVINIIKNICAADTISNRNFLFIGPPGTGKAQPLDSLVLTTSGYKKMGDIQVGDEVFTGSGNRGKVSGVYPQGVRPIYKITLQDRTSIEVSDEHLNVFFRYNADRKCREDYCMNTLEMLKLFETSRFKLRIDVPEVDWLAQELPVDPYLVGALIGDGSLNGDFKFSNSEEDVVGKVDDILRRDWGKMLRKVPGDNVDYDIVDIETVSHKYTFIYKSEQYCSVDSIQGALMSEGYPMFDGATLVRMGQGSDSRVYSTYPELRGALQVSIDPNYHNWIEGDPLRNALRSLDLMHKSTEKHIPHQYLFNSHENRLRLLQGLFDTDGYIDTSGAVTFTTCSDTLSAEFEFLVRSLGIRDTVSSYPAKYTSNGQVTYTGSTAHDHNLKVSNDLEFCTSAKHIGRRTVRQNPPIRNIVSIEYVRNAECQCIMIDHPDHTYISDGFIPTHNTSTARAIGHELNGSLDNIIELDAASHSGVNDMREIIEQARAYPVGSKYKIFILDEVHSFSSAAWQSALKTLEEQPARSIFILCTTNPEKIPATIISRVQTFQLSKISLEGIVGRLKYIIEQENKEGRHITYTEDAIQYIGKMAQGGLRDSITLLDKALAYSEDITSEMLQEALGLPNYDDYFTLLNAYAKKQNDVIVKMINDVYNSGVNFIKWFEGFFSFVTNIVKYIYIKDINATMIPSMYQDKIQGYTVAHAALCLRLSNMLTKMIQELKGTQYLQELAISYLCTPEVSKKG